MVSIFGFLVIKCGFRVGVDGFLTSILTVYMYGTGARVQDTVSNAVAGTLVAFSCE